MSKFMCTVNLGKGRITEVPIYARNIYDARQMCMAQYGNCLGLYQVLRHDDD